MKFGGLIVAWLLSLLATSAWGADPTVPDRGNGFYFNRPGGTLEQVDADYKACDALASGTRSEVYAGGGLAGALVGGIVAGMRKASEHERNIETCMVVRGWRQVVLTAAQWSPLKEAINKDRALALKPLVGADPITFGVVGWTWANDYADPRPVGEDAR